MPTDTLKRQLLGMQVLNIQLALSMALHTLKPKFQEDPLSHIKPRLSVALPTLKLQLLEVH